MTIDPTDSYRRNRTCRVRGCQRPAAKVFPTRVRFPSPDNGDVAGNAAIAVTLVLCDQHAADAVAGMRDRTATISRTTISGAALRVFEQYLDPSARHQDDGGGA